MDAGIVNVFRDMIDVLKYGGPYAGWALFIILWWRKDSEVRAIRREVTNLAVMQVETSVKTERTLISVGEALEGLADHVSGVEKILDKILLLKQLRVHDGELGALPSEEEP